MTTTVQEGTGEPRVARPQSGIGILVRAVALLLRMRNVWMVMAIFAALQAAVVVTQLHILFDPPAQLDHSVKGQAIAAAQQVAMRWREPTMVVANFLRGVQRPLNASFDAVNMGFMKVATRVTGAHPEFDKPLPGPWLLLSVLALNFVYAGLTAGVLGWIRAAADGQRLRARTFWRGAARGFGATYLWFLIVDTISLVIHSATVDVRSIHVMGAILSGVAMLFFPFLLLPAVAVVRGLSFPQAAADSMRLLRTRWQQLLVLLLAYRVVAEALSWVDACFDVSTRSLHTLSGDLVWTAPVVVFLAALVKSGAALFFCSGLILTAVEAEAPQPSQPEAVRV